MKRVYLLYTGNPFTGTLAKSEDLDEILHIVAYAIFGRKNSVLSERNLIFI